MTDKLKAKLVKYDKMDQCQSEFCIKEEEIETFDNCNIKIEACIENDETEAHCSEETEDYSIFMEVSGPA